jgi:hypothetical protein
LRNGTAFYFDGTVSEHISEVFMISLRKEGDCITLFSCPCGSSYSMNVIFGGLWNIVIINMADVLDI